MRMRNSTVHSSVLHSPLTKKCSPKARTEPLIPVNSVNTSFAFVPWCRRPICHIAQTVDWEQSGGIASGDRFRLMRGHFKMCKFTKYCFLVCGFFWNVAAEAQTPSFDCNKARYADEFAICRTPELAKLDNIVADGYGYLKARWGTAYADEIGIPFWRMRQTSIASVKGNWKRSARITPQGHQHSFPTSPKGANSCRHTQEPNRRHPMLQYLR